MSKLIREGRIAPPRARSASVLAAGDRGTITYLNARPDAARRIRAAIHMDMVGGGPETKAVFHVTRGPASLPSFVYDVAEHFGAFASEQSDKFASGDATDFSLHAPEGGREPLQAALVEFTMGSDHQVYTDSSFGVPSSISTTARPIHPHQLRHARQRRSDQTQARRLHRRCVGYSSPARGQATRRPLPSAPNKRSARAARMLERRAALADAAEPQSTRFQL